MSELTIRHLQVDLETPWPRHWAGGEAFRSALFNALSFSFPVGEQFFIDSVKKGAAKLPYAQRERFDAEIKGFVGQEATHRRIHQRFNQQLEAQGYVNGWEARIRRRIAKRLEGRDVRAWVGATAATEHFTAMLAEYLLTTPSVLQGAEPRLRDLWLWHASEESEHRATAFDLYRALGGNEVWRRRLYLIITWNFTRDLARQTLLNLWRDGHWWRPGTWTGAWRLLFGRDGIVRHTWHPWRAYLRQDFHPSQGDGTPAARWLAEHAELAPPVSRG